MTGHHDQSHQQDSHIPGITRTGAIFSSASGKLFANTFLSSEMIRYPASETGKPAHQGNRIYRWLPSYHLPDQLQAPVCHRLLMAINPGQDRKHTVQMRCRRFRLSSCCCRCDRTKVCSHDLPDSELISTLSPSIRKAIAMQNTTADNQRQHMGYTVHQLRI